MTEWRLRPQFGRRTYFGRGYMNPSRFASYGYQISEVLALEPKKVLEVGIGNGVCSYVLRGAGIDVTTVDFDAALRPDIVGSVIDMPLADRTFEVVACFEVLEHMPYELAVRALQEIHRVCSRSAVISLPDARSCVRVRIPLIGRREFLVEMPLWRMRDGQCGGGHYWEVNTRGYPLTRILGDMKAAGFCVEATYRLWMLPWHRFFRLRAVW
jgi:hypothetical protein